MLKLTTHAFKNDAVLSTSTADVAADPAHNNLEPASDFTSLPQDGFLSNMRSISIDVSESSSETVDTDLGPSSEDICDDSHLCQSYVMTEQEAIQLNSANPISH